MSKKKISAEIIADSKNEHGQRITTFILTYPRIIHAELLTHRLFSRNAASSRAIPASKMIENVENDPFIPVAFQKAHSGMQGTEYFEGDDERRMRTRWINSSKSSILSARTLLEENLTKQIINRILEPYQWYTCIVTATEFDNFFALRCPQYSLQVGDKEAFFKSEKDLLKANPSAQINIDTEGVLWKLKNNKGAGEIHISLLAEAMWDAMNESEPKQLKSGEWHIPFGDKIDTMRVLEEIVNPNGDLDGDLDKQDELIEKAKIKIATARCARVSYLNYEGKDDYKADIKLFVRLSSMGHYSPFEHCAIAMSKDEYYSNVKGFLPTSSDLDGTYFKPEVYLEGEHKNRLLNNDVFGWSRNFRGFIQLRTEID